MTEIFNFITNNQILYWLVAIIVVILIVIISIVLLNQNNRAKIKQQYNSSIEKLEENISHKNKEDEELSKKLETILSEMQKKVDIKPEMVVAQFEEEQEKNAIISYKELKEKVTNQEQDQDLNIYNTSFDNEIESAWENFVDDEYIEEKSNDDQQNTENEPKSFTSNEFISPVYGKVDNNFDYPTIKSNNGIKLSETLTAQELDDEIERSKAFLKELIEFRNNL